MNNWNESDTQYVRLSRTLVLDLITLAARAISRTTAQTTASLWDDLHKIAAVVDKTSNDVVDKERDVVAKIAS